MLFTIVKLVISAVIIIFYYLVLAFLPKADSTTERFAVFACFLMALFNTAGTLHKIWTYKNEHLDK